MIRQTVALRYSRAIFKRDVHKGYLKKRVVEFYELMVLLKKNPKLVKFFKSPNIDTKDKEEVLKKCLDHEADPFFIGFLTHILEKGRICFLAEIGWKYSEMVDDYYGIAQAKLITPTRFDLSAKEKLRKKLQQHFQKTIEFEEEIDPGLIGGARLIIGNQMIDWSVKNRLKKLKENLLQFKLADS